MTLWNYFSLSLHTNILLHIFGMLVNRFRKKNKSNTSSDLNGSENQTGTVVIRNRFSRKDWSFLLRSCKLGTICKEEGK